MYLRSVAIPENSTIELAYAEPGVGGKNLVPDLSWGDAPEGTKSFALTCFDPDAPTGSGWWHWVAIDIPTDSTGVAEGGDLPLGTKEWVNDYGYVGWGGPWPPPGPAHRYIFTLHAVDLAELGVPADATHAVVRFTLSFHILASVSFTARFAVA
ncbi:MAG: YbhB/YbcL family Raf kinase inhibitor-like protein [Micropruina sp.]|nr:YbhB/YbcL family Raf kinase inhibitor-like protein [Micropruina sp.]